MPERCSIIAGENTGTGTLALSGAIVAGNDIGSLTVKSSIIGNTVGGHVSRVMIVARGQAVPKGSSDLAIGKITVGGNVNVAAVFAGFNASLAGKNADAQIGSVSVKGNWGQSSIAAGVTNATSSNVNFGDANDALITGAGVTNNAAILSKIASITIGGAVSGTPSGTNASDHFGFVAEQVLALKIGGVKQVLTPTAHTDNLALGVDGDFSVHEV